MEESRGIEPPCVTMPTGSNRVADHSAVLSENYIPKPFFASSKISSKYESL